MRQGTCVIADKNLLDCHRGHLRLGAGRPLSAPDIAQPSRGTGGGVYLEDSAEGVGERDVDPHHVKHLQRPILVPCISERLGGTLGGMLPCRPPQSPKSGSTVEVRTGHLLLAGIADFTLISNLSFQSDITSSPCRAYVVVCSGAEPWQITYSFKNLDPQSQLVSIALAFPEAIEGRRLAVRAVRQRRSL